MKSTKGGVIATVSFSGFLFGALAMDLLLNGPLGAEAAKDDADEAIIVGNADEQIWKDLVPENNSTGVYQSAMDYVKMIEPELGLPPAVDCGENIEIPIYVDGERFTGNAGQHECDNPSLQAGYCNSGSSVGRYEGVTADGVPLPQVVWVSFCRHPGSVQLIGYNSETGATAFFESGGASDRYAYTDPETNRMLGKVPGPEDPDGFNSSYRPPGDIQCTKCHQNDPFIHNSFIDSALLPGTNEPVIPRLVTRGMDMEFDLPYYVIGASHWDMRTIHIEGNKCLKCHRMAMKTFEEFVGDKWNPNEHMPPNDPGSLSEDLREIFDCWKNGPENTPGCDWFVPAAGDSLGRVVGDDYPYKSDFNRPGRGSPGDGYSQRPFTDFDSLDELIDNIENGPRMDRSKDRDKRERHQVLLFNP